MIYICNCKIGFKVHREFRSNSKTFEGMYEKSGFHILEVLFNILIISKQAISEIISATIMQITRVPLHVLRLLKAHFQLFFFVSFVKAFFPRSGFCGLLGRLDIQIMASQLSQIFRENTLQMSLRTVAFQTSIPLVRLVVSNWGGD